jgi:predicted transcriptional regulator
MTDATSPLAALTAQIVSAYVSRHDVPRADIAKLVSEVHAALQGLGAAPLPAPPPAEKRSTKKTVFPEYIVCLEDGRRFKSLKRHLRAKYNLTPEQYRAKWGLPADYPMVAPRYAQERSTLAKNMGLGHSAKSKG